MGERRELERRDSDGCNSMYFNYCGARVLVMSHVWAYFNADRVGLKERGGEGKWEKGLC